MDVERRPSMSNERRLSMSIDIRKSARIRPTERETSKWSAWYKILLYGKAESADSEQDNERHPWSDPLCAMFLICVVVAVSLTVLYFQIATWPSQIDSYYTDDPHDNSHGGLSYTCGCSLPASVQSVQNPVKDTNLNVCHPNTDLETSRILMFSNSGAESWIKNVIDKYSLTPHKIKTVEGGFGVSQEAHDLSFGRGVPFVMEQDKFLNLSNLYLGGQQQPDIFPSLSYLQGPSFNDFPKAYMRMSWMYDCNNCSTCALESVNKLSTRVIPSNQSAWVSCFYYGGNANRCSSHNYNNYTAKCVPYPPDELPGNFAVQRFLQSFLNLTGITNIRASEPPFVTNVTALQPNILYLNVSQATNSSIRLTFVEVEKGSALSSKLLSKFPSMESECANLTNVTVCNETSFCNMFRRADNYDLTCMDATNSEDCLQFKSVGSITPDNVHTDNPDFSEIMCPSSPNCVPSPPYLVIWNTSEAFQNDPLNSFLASNYLHNEWAQRSGVCTNTYTNVIRHQHAADGAGGAASSKVEPMFLHTDCVEDTPTQSGFCCLTGYYHNLSASPGGPMTRLRDDVFWSNRSRFACYRVQPEGFMGWFITTVGVLFGWIGTIQLVFYAVFFWLYVPARRKLDRTKPAPV